MTCSDNALNILTAKSYRGIGNAWIVTHLSGKEPVEAIVDLLANKSVRTSVGEFKSKKQDLARAIESYIGDHCDGIVAHGDDEFPWHRGQVNQSERPVVLFYKGRLELLSLENTNVAVIGLLDPDEDIEARERRIVAKLVGRGATIVSGLARGCDTIAHEEALNCNGRTIAVLPSPLTQILPYQNRKLAYEIVENGGLLVTEYHNDAKKKTELRGRYVQRDRLQAMFSDVVVLVASYAEDSATRTPSLSEKLDSGARLAMGRAKDYHIPRAVMYDEHLDGSNPKFDLNRHYRVEDGEVITISIANECAAIDLILQSKAKVAKTREAQHRLWEQG